ncbi:MAG: S9 family peptidase [Flavobacteriales bacterium]|nr:S9 family peptidase [Flavobacteriales bacterium]
MLRFTSTLVGMFTLISQLTIAQSDREITLEDIWKTGTFRSEGVYGLRSMNDGMHYTTLDMDRGGAGTVNKYSYETGELVSAIFSSTDLAKAQTGEEGIKIDSYTLSSDESKVLISSETEAIYRHSTQEKNYIFNLKTKNIDWSSETKQRYATLSPDGEKLAFVKDNNLFVGDLIDGSMIQITTDGSPNKIINGATDWVYEEEFAFDKAFFWSPSGKYIAYMKFDESEVPEFNMPKYNHALYPSDYKFKYPKAGEVNANVSIHAYDLTSKATIQAQIPDYYKARIKWSTNDDFFTVTGLNRHQNEVRLYSVNPVNGQISTLLEEKNNTYIDIHDNLTFLSGNKKFIWTSEVGGFNHIYLYNGKKKTQITQGNWEVTEMYGVDEKNGLIYFEAAKESPMKREVYRIKISGNGLTKLSSKSGTNSASFSSGFQYFILTHSSANTPPNITLNSSDGKEIRNLKDNASLKAILGQYPNSPQEFFSFKTSEDIQLNGSMIKPINFDPNKKYPVLMYVYGGPGSQTVKDSWGGANYLWYQMLANKGYLIVSVDNRGTGARGEDFKKLTYLQLGKYETVDQIEAAKWLAKQPYVDANRIGIWGWSYGGYMSSLCLFKGADVFKMAVAVAPVTNWKFYDTIYTERYMQTPAENPGYDENSPITHVDKLKGKYLLIHGTADDNVHFQNSVEMVSALQQANKQFDLMVYPDRNHGIYGGNTRLHLYNLLTEYIYKNL